MANPILGRVTCPFCGNESATVHREARGLRALYFRCYSDDVDRSCGTVQIRYPSGQRWIERNMAPLDMAGQDAAAAEAASEAAALQIEAARGARKRSRLGEILFGGDE